MPNQKFMLAANSKIKEYRPIKAPKYNDLLLRESNDIIENDFKPEQSITKENYPKVDDSDIPSSIKFVNWLKLIYCQMGLKLLN